ncbi:MAG: DNA primase [Acidaminococcaceae bacterium]|nr:DNA primase [Acidaminococcaceae bacterium]
MNTLFETVKAAVRPREAAERYGLPVSQGGMACCPFHDDRTPSLRLYEDHFFCFGCGKYGDLIDLAGQLLGLGPGDAVERLAADFGIDTKQRCSATQYRSEIHQFREDEANCFSVLMDYLRLLEHWKVSYAPSFPEAPMDDRYAEACQMLDRIEYMVDVLTVGSVEQRKALVNKLTSTGMIKQLLEYVSRKKERATDEEEQSVA